MIKKPELIRDKNIVLHGGTYDERQKNVASIKNAFLSKWHTGTIFTLSEQPRNYERFLKSVRMKLPVKSDQVEQNKYNMSSDHLSDCYLDWVSNYRSVLVILPEFDKFLSDQPEYFYQVIGDMLAKQQALAKQIIFRFVLTLAEESPIEMEKIPVSIGGSWRPSKKEIEIVTISF